MTASTVTPALEKAVEKQFPAAVKLRRNLHRHPELSFAEYETAKTIAAELKRIGCTVTTGVGRTGVVGILRSGKGGRCVAIRSDMDALPVTEETGLPFASLNKGVMHACGHDSHMATVVSTGAILAQFKEAWQGTVKLIFQASEEAPPGGAIEMIEEGVLHGPDVDMIFGLHVDPWISIGKVGIKDGPMMARVDDFDITVTGQSGHGARPHLGYDAVYIAAQVINAMQSIASRNTDPLQPIVVTIGQIHGGTARNILAGSVQLEGTLRTLDATVSAKAKSLVQKIAKKTAAALGGDAAIEFHAGYPALVNAKAANDIYRQVIKQNFGARAVVELKEPLMGGEDFAYFLQHVPGAMMRVGVRNASLGATYAWHHSKFTIDERAMAVGARILSGAAMTFLNQQAA